MMKKMMLALVLVVMTVGIASAGVQDFTVYNDNDFDIYEIYVTPSDSYDWGDNLLGYYGVLYSWDSVDIEFPYSSSDCYWDIMIVDEDGDTGYAYGVDLCGIYSLHFEWDYYDASYYAWTE